MCSSDLSNYVKILKEEIKEIESTIIEAKTIEDLDRADILLNMDLGVGADGQPRGRITDRKNDKVLLLKEKLAKRRRALEVQEREDKANAEKEDVKNIFAEANKDNEFTDDDGSLIKVPKTYEEKLKLREKLAELAR